MEPSSEHGPSTIGSLPHYIYKHSYAQKNRTQESHCDVQGRYIIFIDGVRNEVSTQSVADPR
jgi:hypothetical protein